MRRTPALGLALISLVAAPAAALAQDVAPTIVASFDPAQGQLPESFTTDGQGNFFFSMNHRVMKLDAGGTLTQLAELPAASDLVFALGLKIGPDGLLYVALASFSPLDGASSVWRVSPTTGAAEEFVHLDDTGFPNDLVFDSDGNLFVTDPFLGRIWRVDPAGTATDWLTDPVLRGDPPGGYLYLHDFGVDGIAFDRNEHRLYVGNLDHGEIIRIQVRHDGSASAPQVWVRDERLLGADGITFDRTGTLYVAVNGQDQVLAIAPSRRISVLAYHGVLDGPSAVVLSPDQRTLYVSNFAISSAFGTPRSRHPLEPAPSLVSLELR